MSDYTSVSVSNKITHFYTSLWIEKSPPRENDYYRMMYCMYCGTPLMQTDGIIYQIIPGETPTNVGMIVMCRKKTCQARYKIQGEVGNV